MLRFLLDEHLRGPLWLAILRHNAQGGLPIDGARGGDASDLPLGSDDATIFLWAEREGRILLTEDVHTMPGHWHGICKQAIIPRVCSSSARAARSEKS